MVEATKSVVLRDQREEEWMFNWGERGTQRRLVKSSASLFKGPLSHRWEAKEEHSLEKALVQLEEEQQR